MTAAKRKTYFVVKYSDPNGTVLKNLPINKHDGLHRESTEITVGTTVLRMKRTLSNQSNR